MSSEGDVHLTPDRDRQIEEHGWQKPTAPPSADARPPGLPPLPRPPATPPPEDRGERKQ